MIPLLTQEQFEALYFDTEHPDNHFIVYFTAAWCGPCKALDCDAIAAAATKRGIPIYKCDYVTNEYTVGYCRVNSFPTFLYFKPKKPVSDIRSNKTAEVIDWINILH